MRLFCKHKHFDNYKTISSRKEGNDNIVYETVYQTCKKCKKKRSFEVVFKIEKDWYLK